MTAAAAPKVAKRSNRGSAPGERRGGRVKGVPNKATASIREAAKEYTEQALMTLAEVMTDEGQPGAARVSAANAILDRGYGKPTQPIAGDDTADPLRAVTEIILRGVRPDEDG